MGAVDPTYPLLPIASIIAAILLLVVFLSSFVRQSWNLGVAFLCFWVFFENLTFAINAIIWSDNADVKLYVYCDIVSHIQLIAFVVKPMSTLLIMHRLYLIASLRSVELPSKATRRWDRLLEWSLGLTIPLIVAGPVYYTFQGTRFIVREGLGCTDSPDNSIASVVIINAWPILPPLLTVAIYYPRVAKTLYRQSREFNHFLCTNQSISRTNYIRILTLASINIFLILSLNVTIFASTTVFDIIEYPGALPFYTGWNYLHIDWNPVGISWADLEASGKSAITIQYLSQWTSVAHSLTIFALFGLTAGARASYRRAICTVAGLFGWKPTCRGRSCATRSVLSSIRFNSSAPPQEVSLASCELGFPPSVVLDIAPPPPDANVESKIALEDAKADIDDSKDSICCYSDESKNIKRELYELDAETIDIGEVSLSSSAMAV